LAGYIIGTLESRFRKRQGIGVRVFGGDGKIFGNDFVVVEIAGYIEWQSLPALLDPGDPRAEGRYVAEDLLALGFDCVR